MNFKNLLWTGLITVSCYAGYNPDGFACTIESNDKIWKISMTKPPLYLHQCNEEGCEFADGKIYLDSLEFSIGKSAENNIHDIKWTIASNCFSSAVDIKNTRVQCSIHNDQRPDLEPYTITLSISDFFKSSIYADFNSGFGGRIRLQWIMHLEWVIEAINSLAAAKCGPKIFIDEYLQQ